VASGAGGHRFRHSPRSQSPGETRRLRAARALQSQPPVQPHDRLFRAVFSQPQHAEGLLRAVLPPAIAARLDFSALQTLPSTFIAPALREHRADLLFSVTLDAQPAFVYVLLEHQSTVDPLMPLRVLEYMLRIWDEHLRAPENDGAVRVPPIVPIVFHHSHSGWTAPTAFRDVLAMPADVRDLLEPHLPSFELILDDLSRESDDALRARILTALGHAALVCLTRVRGAHDVLSVLDQYFDVFAAVANAQSGLAALAQILSYILEATDTPPERLGPFVSRLGPVAKEALVTGADMLRAEGEAKGRAKGKAEGKAEGKTELLTRLLRLKYGEVPEPALALLRQASSEELDLWAERVLTAATLEEVFA